MIDVTNEIKKWDKEFLENENKDILYEIAFFKIFVKFEVFVSKVFIKYASGEGSEEGYIVKRKLAFKDEKHLKVFLKDGNSSFVNYYDKIPKLSKYIFEDKKDPFWLIFSSGSYSSYLNQMKAIRNYIAHESEESKKIYIEDVLRERSFVYPFEYLGKMNSKRGKTNYSILVGNILEMMNLLSDPASFLGDEDIKVKEIIQSKASSKV
ncbi:hypothetical protein [Clostridium gasigenes]|uniref:Uncharacterized protein n=1 Tax=Clostridium gasigenes TaxID=94869 RepID=A0A7X0VSN4_9CLOT|nr:hypothetical protein [Clostridium gasigenes]MBB6714781.1 hypothetical protein [Clostridium gasigenes]